MKNLIPISYILSAITAFAMPLVHHQYYAATVIATKMLYQLEFKMTDYWLYYVIGCVLIYFGFLFSKVSLENNH